MQIDLSNVKRKKMTIDEEVFRVDHSSWEELYKEDLDSGTVIMISDSKIITNALKPNKDSLFDSKFNIPSDIDSKVVEYACECQNLIGRYNEGEICPNCNTVVEIRYSIELLRRGWIDLHDFKIIIPAMYNKIRAYIGRKKLEEMLIIDSNVFYDSTKIEPSNPYKGIGIIEFERRYVEILEFFKNSTNKPDLFDVLLERKDITFSSKIYVMSSAHRPGYISAKHREFSFHDINTSFVKILTDFNLVLKGKRVGRKAVEILGNIQTYLMDIYTLSVLKIHGKSKLIRSNVIAGRLWYSSRMVIVSETSNIGIDCVRMSYKGFLGMFELEIMNAMLRGFGNPEFAKMTTAECRMYLKTCKFANEVDESIYSIIHTLIHKRKDDGLWVIVDRNPSFDLGSLQCFRIADVFKDVNKNVLTIPHNSLIEFSGDYDGDVLNVYSPKEKCVVEAFKNGFRPSKLILDRSGGYYNTNMAPIKDEYAFLRSFFDKEYKPIDPEKVDLRTLEEITKDVEKMDEIDRLSEALFELNRFRSEVDNPLSFDIKNRASMDIINMPITNDDQHIESSEEISIIDNYKKKLSFSIFDHVDRSAFLPM